MANDDEQNDVLGDWRDSIEYDVCRFITRRESLALRQLYEACQLENIDYVQSQIEEELLGSIIREDVSLIQWIYNTFDGIDVYSPVELLQWSLQKCNNLNSIQWLVMHYGIQIAEERRAIEYATLFRSKVQIAILKWLLSQGCTANTNAIHNIYASCDRLLIQWAVDNLNPSRDDIIGGVAHLCANEIRLGDIKWIHSVHKFTRSELRPAFKTSCVYGNLCNAAALHEICCFTRDDFLWVRQFVEQASRVGIQKSIQWLDRNMPSC